MARPTALCAMLAAAAVLAACGGENSTGDTGWTPPCPPSGTHRYQFELYWLRAPSKLAPGAGPQEVVDAIQRAAAGRGELIGRYGKSG
jgi:phosphatidylethanolamine-binding protein (PEBP) family uncharacterized protein